MARDHLAYLAYLYDSNPGELTTGDIQRPSDL